jgi:hypothetical protein
VESRQPEQFQCPSAEPQSVSHEQEVNEIHSRIVDRTQTPADGHGEKEICREGNFNTVTVSEPSSIVNTNAQLQEILDSILSVKQSVREGNEKLQRDIEQSVKGEITKLKEEFRLENKKLIEHFEKENIKLSKSFDEKLQKESDRTSKLVQQVRDEREGELTAAKKNIEAVSKELHNKLDSHVTQTTEQTSRLESQITLHKERADKQVNEMKDAIKSVQIEMTNSAQTWQKEAGERVQNLKIEFEKLKSTNDQLRGEVNAIKTKLSASATDVCSSDTLPPIPSQASSESADNVNFNTTNEINHNECMHANISDATNLNWPVSRNVNPYALGSVLNPTELSLPYFDDSSKINSMYHLKQLDEYFTLKGVPKEMQLAIALRSITDPTAKDWVSAVSHTLNDYSQFKSAFTKVYWSQVTQSNVRKSIYQDKYDKQSGLTLSGHFLKYAVLASYLQPKMADVELINALMSHFSLNIQRGYASVQMSSIQDAINFLQRLESIEGNNGYQGSNCVPKPQETQNPHRSQPYNSRSKYDNNFVRQTYVPRPSQFNQRGQYWRGNRENTEQGYGRQRDNGRRSTSSNRQALDPNAPPYSSHVAQNERAEDMPANGNNRRSEN